ncbi:MAG: site-specific DNA-methyltransferase [Bacteroidota bacterium]
MSDHFINHMVRGLEPAYLTKLGATFLTDSRHLLASLPDESVDLIITSPPFALLRKKEYGNEDQADYVEWLGTFATAALPKLKSTGSLVMDIGGAYQRGTPTRSLYPFRVPIHFCDNLGYHLAEDFYWFNSSKLPSPIEWVNKRKIRAKDSVNTVWWFSKTEWPYADVSQVLTEYSDRMKKLLKDPAKFYDAKKRPSGHDIGTSFGTDNGGAIPSNLLQIPNSESGAHYITSCKLLGVKSHPARFPAPLPEFFIKMLTKPGDLVIDIFSGSNTTGEVAERLGRRWIACDMDNQYVAASSFRFLSKQIGAADILEHPYHSILNGQMVDLRNYNNWPLPILV